MSMSNIDISIVIIEYNSLNNIKDCVDKILSKCKSVKYEIIVSSNSCYDKQIQLEILKNFSNCKWVFNPKNGGFAYGMNQGLSIATGRYLAISNPDTILKTDLNEMLDFMNRHEEIGAIAPQIVDNQGVIQDSCRPYVSFYSYVARQFKRIFTRQSLIYEKNFDYNKIQTVDWVIGAFIMVRKEVYIRTNGLDEKYFMYNEDLDWCTRIRSIGYEIVYFPPTIVEYKGSRAARSSLKYAAIFLKSITKFWLNFGFFKGYPPRKNYQFNR